MADFKGKFLVIIFFKNNDSKEFLKAFSDLADLFRGNKIEVWKIKLPQMDYQSNGVNI